MPHPVSRLLATLALILVALVGGCVGDQYRSDLFRAQLMRPYALASGDRLRVIVFGQDSLTNSYSLDATGHISMPLIGLVPASGLTASELERSVEARLRNGFIREPRVAIEVEAYRPFFVLGEVTTAGQYPFVNGMTVENAIAIAGGFTPRGYQSSAVITRTIDGVQATAEVPITYPVRPGDTIMVKERFF